jgi:hypothetical protein
MPWWRPPYKPWAVAVTVVMSCWMVQCNIDLPNAVGRFAYQQATVDTACVSRLGLTPQIVTNPSLSDAAVKRCLELEPVQCPSCLVDQMGLEGNNSVVMATFVSEGILEYALYAAFFNTIYATNHGYLYFIISEDQGWKADNNFEEPDKRWAKIDAVTGSDLWRAASMSVLAVLDADLIILNMSFDVLHVVQSTISLSAEKPIIFMCEDAVDIANTGFMIIVNTPESLTFMNAWQAERQHVPGVDQHVLNALLLSPSQLTAESASENGFVRHIKILPATEFNSLWPTINTHKLSNNVIHLMGETTDFRIEVFRWMFQQFICTLNSSCTVGGLGVNMDTDVYGNYVFRSESTTTEGDSSKVRCDSHLGLLLSLDDETLSRLYFQLWSRRRRERVTQLSSYLKNESRPLSSGNREDDVLTALSSLIALTGTLCDDQKNVFNHFLFASDCVLMYQEVLDLLSPMLSDLTMSWSTSGVEILKQRILVAVNLLWFVDPNADVLASSK